MEHLPLSEVSLALVSHFVASMERAPTFADVAAAWPRWLADAWGQAIERDGIALLEDTPGADFFATAAACESMCRQSKNGLAVLRAVIPHRLAALADCAVILTLAATRVARSPAPIS
jgi:hypothetical protein